MIVRSLAAALVALLLALQTKALLPAIDILSPLTGHLFVLAAAAVLACRAATVPRAALTLAAGAVVAVLAHGFLAPSSPERAWRTGEPRRSGLRVVALNTWHQQHDTTAIESYLRSADADVVVLSELDAGSKRTMIEALRDVYPHQVSCAEIWPCSMALLSRFPLEEAGAERIDLDTPPMVWARVRPPLAGAPEGVTVVGTHVHRPSRNPWRHLRQLDALAQRVLAIKGPLVVAGDFNAGPFSHGFQDFSRKTGLSRHATMAPTWPAWPVALPQVALDHVLVSADLAVVRGGTGPKAGSDHLPVWAEVAPRDTGDPSTAPVALKRAPQSDAAAALHLGIQLLADFAGEHHASRNLRRR